MIDGDIKLLKGMMQQHAPGVKHFIAMDTSEENVR